MPSLALKSGSGHIQSRCSSQIDLHAFQKEVYRCGKPPLRFEL